MTTTREVALEQALRNIHTRAISTRGDQAYREFPRFAEKASRAALALPPDTHSAGYVEGPTVAQVQQAWTEERNRLMDEIAALTQALAARPALPDTRVVTVEQLEKWVPFLAASEFRAEIFAIIDGGQDRG